MPFNAWRRFLRCSRQYRCKPVPRATSASEMILKLLRMRQRAPMPSQRNSSGVSRVITKAAIAKGTISRCSQILRRVKMANAPSATQASRKSGSHSTFQGR